MNESTDAITELMGRDVVLDVASQYVFVGTLVAQDHKYVILENADVHDLRDSNTARELYVLDSKRHGVRSNRQRVLVRVEELVSISALDEVLD